MSLAMRAITSAFSAEFFFRMEIISGVALRHADKSFFAFAFNITHFFFRCRNNDLNNDIYYKCDIEIIQTN